MDKQAIIDKLKGELDNISEEMKKLEVKLNDLGEEAKVTYKKQIEDMQKLYNNAEEKFEQAKNITEDKWDEVKDNIDLTRKALKNSYSYFMSHYKKK